MERFWNKVEKSEGCWTWKGGTSFNGHHRFGMFRYLGAHRKDSRVAFHLTHGRWPVMALHHCDNPMCVNPSHLYDGDHAQNMRDRSDRDRTKQQWHFIRDRAKDLRRCGYTQQQIADWFGCSWTSLRATLAAS